MNQDLTAAFDQLARDIRANVEAGTTDSIHEDLTALEKIQKINSSGSDEKNFLEQLDPNVIVGGAVNLAGILLVLNHERLHAIGGKAFNLISKIRF